MIKSVLRFSLLFFLVACSKEEITPGQPQYYQEVKNAVYGQNVRNVMDVYLPENRTTNTKMVLLLHGGGWTTGDKWEMEPFVDTTMMRENNIAFANMNYRLATQNEFKHPAQMEDIAAAIQFLKSKSAEWVFNKDTFAIVGASAGGHLALLYAYGFDTNKDIKLAVNCVGPMNFWAPEMLQDTARYLSVLGLLGKMHWEDEALWKNASPFYQVKEKAPATLIFLGDQDAIVPISQGQEMKQKLDDLLIKNELTIYPGAGHGWWPNSSAFSDTKNKISAFIKKELF